MYFLLVGLAVLAGGECPAPGLQIPVARADAALASGMDRPVVKAPAERKRPLQTRIKSLRSRVAERRAGRSK